jgi:2-dehydro-3-deoxygalactonokinase
MGEGVLDSATSDAGMGTLDPSGFEPALLALVGRWLGSGVTPVLCCGMVGARQGWAEAGYRAVPCTPLAGPFTRVATADGRIDVQIVPGLSQARPADVMRGEETQIAGFLALDPRFDGVICLPGSHTKWAHVSAGEVVSFQTAMSGEIFSALGRHTVLRHSLAADGWDDAAFDSALSDTLSRPETLATRLFTLRAEGLLAGLAPQAARARLSGLLIGAELAATRPYWLGQPVALIGAQTLCAHYARALRAQGIDALRSDATAATLAGLSAAHTLSRTTP